MNNIIKHWLAIFILLLGLFAFFYFDLNRYFTITMLQQHRELLLTYTQHHYFFTVIVFMIIYILTVAFSIPGATILTLFAGFLFGLFFGTVYTVISASIGAICVFLAVRYAIDPIVVTQKLETKSHTWIQTMRIGFQKNATSYLLVLRLVPLFPFWVVNIVPALLGINTRIFIITTIIGIIPGSFVYVWLGNNLGELFASHQTPNLKIIFEPKLFVPLIVLALFILLPNIYQYFQKKK